MGETTLVRNSKPTLAVQVRDFYKRYRQLTAVKGIDLWVNRGEMVGLLGPDGAGKSSLMKALAGVMSYEAGCIDVLGIRLDSELAAERIKQHIGFMPQGLGLNLYPELSVEENIDFFAQLRLVPKALLTERKKRLLAMTRLDRFRHRSMKNLSGGMKQKLGLICTLIHEPELLILDEPTTGVDPVSRRDFWTILTELMEEQGSTALVTTAYLDEASRFHRVALMYEGKILAHGAPETIQAQVSGHLILVKTHQQTTALERLHKHFEQLTPQGPWLRIFTENTSAEDAKLKVLNMLGDLAIENIKVIEPELEDAFIALLRQETKTQAIATLAPISNDSIDTNGRELINRHTTAIEARELTRDFDDFRAADQVSFKVRRGEILGLLGPNGAGKTTVIKMLTGILRPSAGGGQVAGADIRSAGREIKQRIGYMSQAFSLYTELKVMENIQFYAGVYGLRPTLARKRCRWIITMAGLGNYVDWRTAALPVGLRQRLALGCALIHQPQVLFLDEPTSGVDPIGRQQFWDILFMLTREEGITALVSTHYMSEAEHCDQLGLMFAGRLVAHASPSTLKQDVETKAGQLLEIGTDQPTQALSLLTRTGFTEPILFGNRVRVLSQQAAVDEQRIVDLLSTDGITVTAITHQELSMEDVFVYRVRELEHQAQATSVAA